MLYYAIGDIHGMDDLLGDILEQIKTHHAENFPAVDKQLIFLGDYVDRGPKSKDVIDRVMALDNPIILPGNHEDMMLSMFTSINDNSFEQDMMWWGSNGGFQTLQSYFGPDHESSDPKNWHNRSMCVAWMKEFAKNFPTHFEFLVNCVGNKYSPTGKTHHIDVADRIMFVHAGVQPHKLLDDQTSQTFLWTRDSDFLHDRVKWIEPSVDMVVHGHTPMSEGMFAKHRTGLDIGSVFTSHLLCGVFLDGKLVDKIMATGTKTPYHAARF